MSSTNSKNQNMQRLKKVKALIGVNEDTLKLIAYNSEVVIINQGETLLRRTVIETNAFILLDGSLRLLGTDGIKNELFTIGKLEPNGVIGIIDLLRQGPCETAIARQNSKLLSIPLKLIAELLETDNTLIDILGRLRSPCEDAMVFAMHLKKMNPPPIEPREWILEQLKLQRSTAPQLNKTKLLSSVLPGSEHRVGENVSANDIEILQNNSKLPIRFVTYNSQKTDIEKFVVEERTKEQKIKDTENHKLWRPTKILDLEEIGVREARTEADLQGFRPIQGSGAVGSHLASLRMIARAYGTPCQIDALERTIEGAIQRAGSIPIQGMGQMVESMGLQTQVGNLKIGLVNRVELPVLVKYKNHYSLITEANKERILLADPVKGWLNISMRNAEEIWGKSIKLLLIKRLDDTPKKTFGWNWFTPVIKRFKWSLLQVLLASLFIQLFQLANPLLIQQIIDKVINQSNLSALQVLGAALVVSALFQGLLTAVRTWLLIDTTDRMDLLLGSQVIDRLLRLPLRFFEKRPVGELSQRLSELGNLRGFLTGTAITSALDLLFATIYILVMLLYSPLLTAVALGTIPIYVIMIVCIAPIYRKLIRNQARYMARTQSHLIETLGGIQTVKAQHIELNSRWRWQERYSGQIAEGFKSVVLGSSASEFGKFLNQLSSLLIIWVGVYQVVNGDITLGQMIAFRIIAGYVTGPILRLSGLWQGFQKVGISMERLSDIVDQVPEAGEQDADQISLPPIKGEVQFKDLSFRFGNQGAYQINNVNLDIEAGNFIGIVGQSGSGKSTLMKLVPRLYDPGNGRILIDGYNIGKVNLSSLRQQIGIVPQECLLFEGTIRENICMNHPDADTETVIRVSRAAEAHDFIMDLPEGYGTKLGERGAGLSGGQRQRIAIARTLLQNPNLLILDEATSALDYDTEASVCRNLQNELEGKTVFFITHRLSTVRHADKIILMHNGEISEEGTHQELINQKGRYAALYTHQGDA